MDKEQVYNSLKELKTPRKFMNPTRKSFNKTQDEEEWKRQKDQLSTVLFNLVLEVVMRKVTTKQKNPYEINV